MPCPNTFNHYKLSRLTCIWDCSGDKVLFMVSRFWDRRKFTYGPSVSTSCCIVSILHYSASRLVHCFVKTALTCRCMRVSRTLSYRIEMQICAHSLLTGKWRDHFQTYSLRFSLQSYPDVFLWDGRPRKYRSYLILYVLTTSSTATERPRKEVCFQVYRSQNPKAHEHVRNKLRIIWLGKPYGFGKMPCGIWNVAACSIVASYLGVTDFGGKWTAYVLYICGAWVTESQRRSEKNDDFTRPRPRGVRGPYAL